MKIQGLEKLLPWLLVLMTWQSIAPWLIIQLPYSWFIDFVANLALVFIFYRTYQQEKKRFHYAFPITLFALIVVLTCSLIYGFFFKAEDYYDKVAGIRQYGYWMICVGVLFFQNPMKISKLTSGWVKYAVPASLLLIPLMQGEAVGKYFAPFAFLVCFFPILERKAKLITIFVILVILVYGALGARAVAIRFLVGILVAIGIVMHDSLSQKVLALLGISLLLSPFIFLTLAFTTNFNIFQIEDYFGLKGFEVTGSIDKSQKSSALIDTRTFLYSEVIESAIYNEYVVYGRSFARGYDTNSRMFLDEDDTNIHQERRRCEVRILNVFTYMGLVGIVVLFLLHAAAVYSAFRHGKSYIMYFVGLYVAFRWLLSWAEDFERFDLNNLFLWIPIAMCFSPMFLKMTDNEFKIWAKKLI